MLTIEDIIEFLTRAVAEDTLRADMIGLKHIQTTAGVLLHAAQSVGDKDTAYRFRVIAANAANKREDLSGD